MILKFRLGAVCSGLLCLSLACSTNPVDQKEEQENIAREKLARDLSNERDVGCGMAAKLAGHFGIVENDSLHQYLNLVGWVVAAKSGRPEIEYRFAVLKSDEINAFAAPGGYVFVTTAILKAMKSESELAGVLGHEIAHVDRKHMYQAIMPKRDVSAGETLTRMLSRGGSDVGFSLTKVVNAGMELLLEKGLGMEKEQEADTTGIVFAAEAGYDPNALHDLVERIGRAKAGVKLPKTHPPTQERLQHMESFMVENGIKAGGATVDRATEERFQAAVAKIGDKVNP